MSFITQQQQDPEAVKNELQHSSYLLQYQNVLFLCLSFPASTELVGNFRKASPVLPDRLQHPSSSKHHFLGPFGSLEHGTVQATWLSSLTKLPVPPINTTPSEATASPLLYSMSPAAMSHPSTLINRPLYT